MLVAAVVAAQEFLTLVKHHLKELIDQVKMEAILAVGVEEMALFGLALTLLVVQVGLF
jgi:hypothetical protein